MVRTLSCPASKGKVDYFDANCKGLLLEVWKFGGKSWYLRYVNQRGTQHQFRIAHVDDLSLEQARKREVLDAQRQDFDLVLKQWRIPVTKAGKPRHVPLSDSVLLRPGTGSRVQPGTKESVLG